MQYSGIILDSPKSEILATNFLLISCIKQFLAAKSLKKKICLSLENMILHVILNTIFQCKMKWMGKVV